MKRIALMISILMLLVWSVSLFAVNTQATVDKKASMRAESVLPIKDAKKSESVPKIQAQSLIFEEDFEGDPVNWWADGGYANAGGTPDVVLIPPAWALSQDKAFSPVTSMFHGDDVESSRDFVFSPFFDIPTEIDGDPVVSAKVSFQVNIDNPGYVNPASGYLGDYYMIYAGIEEATWSVVDNAGDMVYYSGYPEANSFQYLTSPAIDLTAATAPVALNFSYSMINELNWDLGRIDVLVDGQPGYTTVGQLDDDSGVWSDMSIDLSAFAGQTVMVRFAFLPDDGTAIENGGLWLNNIVVADANGDIFADDAEAGNAVMVASGVTMARLFYDYDRVGDGGAAFYYWDETIIYNGTADLFDLGLQAGDRVLLALRYLADGDNTQGEEASAGVFFDDVMVTAISGLQIDAGISNLVVGYPRTQGLETPVATTVSNFGFEGQTVQLWYNLDGGSGTPVPPFLALDAFADSTRFFNITVPEADSTLVTTYTVLSGDMLADNDAMSEMTYNDPAGVATLSYYNGAVASYTTSNRILMYDPLAVLDGPVAYNVHSVDIMMYNVTAEDVVNIKVATWDDDPTMPTEVIADTNVTIPAGGAYPISILAEKADVTSKLALWFNFDASAKVAGPFLDTGTPWTGNEIFLNAADGEWYLSGRGTFAFANISYSTEPVFNIAIDAEKDAFYDGLTGPDDGYLQIRWFAYNNNGKPANDADLSAKLWAAWDETYLYLYEEVKDNVVHVNHATSWQNDVLEVYLDPDPTATVTTGQIGFQMTALDSADADPAALAGVTNLLGYNLNTGATTADYARKKTADGYVLECRVAWDSLKDATRKITPAVGNVFGMATMNHDNDVAQREGSVSWAAVLNDNVWNTPNNHGAVTFLADNKLQFVATSARSGLVNTLPYDGSIPPIMIDAAKDPFYETLTGPEDGYLYIPHQQYNNNGAPDKDLDLSARLWASWDETYLYFYEEVKDNVVHVNHATSWQNDVLEVYIDPDPTAAVTTGQIGFQMTALDSADADPAALAGVTNLLGYNLTTGATTADYARRKTTDGYVLEGRVKWEVLKDATRAITPAAGNVFGMATMNHDNDVAQREGSVSWAAVLNDNVWNTPNNHATVTFLEDGKLQFTATSTRSGLANAHPEWYDPKVPFAITMDAIMDPWYNQLTGPANGYVYIPAEAANDNGTPDNNKDLSALLWVAWDETYLYFYEEVADNVVNLNHATSWQDDVLEVYFDPDPSATVTTAQIGFHMSALDSADADPAAYAGVINLQGFNLTTGSTTEDYARARTNNGYVLEGRVKWEVLKDATRTIAPAPGTIFGMATMNHDNDVAQREGSVSWAAVLMDNVWNTPNNHATVEFLDNHTLKMTAASTRSGLVNENASMYNPGKIIKVEVEEPKEPVVVPETFNLAQNYPNPFNPTTTIKFDLPIDSQVKLTVFDVLGREVVTLVDERMEAGSRSVTFDAAHFASGVYFYRLQAGDRTFQKKMMLLK